MNVNIREERGRNHFFFSFSFFIERGGTGLWREIDRERGGGGGREGKARSFSFRVNLGAWLLSSPASAADLSSLSLSLCLH